MIGFRSKTEIKTGRPTWNNIELEYGVRLFMMVCLSWSCLWQVVRCKNMENWKSLRCDKQSTGLDVICKVITNVVRSSAYPWNSNLWEELHRGLRGWHETSNLAITWGRNGWTHHRRTRKLRFVTVSSIALNKHCINAINFYLLLILLSFQSTRNPCSNRINWSAFQM